MSNTITIKTAVATLAAMPHSASNNTFRDEAERVHINVARVLHDAIDTCECSDSSAALLASVALHSASGLWTSVVANGHSDRVRAGRDIAEIIAIINAYESISI